MASMELYTKLYELFPKARMHHLSLDTNVPLQRFLMSCKQITECFKISFSPAIYKRMNNTYPQLKIGLLGQP